MPSVADQFLGNLQKAEKSLADLQKIAAVTAVSMGGLTSALVTSAGGLRVSLDAVTSGLGGSLRGLRDLAGAVGGLTGAFAGVGTLAKGLGGAIGTLGEKLAVDLQTALRPLAGVAANALGPLAEAIKPITQKIGAVFGSIGEAGEKLGVDVRSILGPLARGVGEVTSRLNAGAQAIAAAVSGVAGVVGGLGKAAAGVAALVAAPVALFGELGNAVKGFVGSLNPTSVAQFERALESLSAVVGLALQPVLEAATVVMRDFAATMFPIVQQLRPIVAEIAGSLTKVAGTAVNAFAAILTAVLPVVKFFADALEGITPVLRAFAAGVSGAVEVISTLVKSLLRAFGVDVKSVTDTFKQAMEELAKYTLYVVAALLKVIDSLFGLDKPKEAKPDDAGKPGEAPRPGDKAKADEPAGLAADFIRGVKRAFDDGVPKKDASGLPAAKNAQVADLPSFTKTLSTAAFLAAPGGPGPSKEDKFREDVVKLLDSLNQKSGEDVLRQIRDEVRAIGKKVGAEIFDGAAEKAAKSPFVSPAGYLIGRILGG